MVAFPPLWGRRWCQMAKVKCKYCGEAHIKSEMVLHTRTTSSGRQYREYYHSECLKLKQARDKAVDLFYKYTESLEPIKMVNIAFKQLKDQGVNEHEILYIMEYIAKNQCVLNYAMGIKYYATPAMKEYKNRRSFLHKQQVNQKKDTDVGIVTDVSPTTKQNINIDEDHLDISSFL